MLSTDLEIVSKNGFKLSLIKNQTKEICLAAVKNTGLALQFVKEQDDEICLEAVKHSFSALGLVKKQTKEICLEAVKRNGHALHFAQKQTKEMCLEAVKQNINNFLYVNVKYAKFIYNYMISINFIHLDKSYHHIINNSVENTLKQYCSRGLQLMTLKFVKQDSKFLGLLKRLKLFSRSNLNNFSYINFKKTKLCLQIIKIFYTKVNKGFGYINKQYIEVLL